MGGEAERRLHFRHGPPPPQGKGDAVSRVWALSRQVLPTGRRLAGGSRGLGPWPGPPPSPGARHFCRRCPCAGPSSNPPVVSPQSAVPHVCGGDTQTPASVNPKRRRPPRLSGGGLGDPTAKEAPSPQRRGPRCPKAKEAPSPQRRGPRWSQSQRGPLASAAGASVSQSKGGPLASAEGASVVPKSKRPPRPSGGGLGGPKEKEAPSPQRRGPR